MDRSQVADILEEVGTLLELKGDNPFKVRAYFQAARTILSLAADLETLIADGRLAGLKGIGEALNQKITELVNTGRMAYHQELLSSVPNGLLEMLKIPSLGPKKVRMIHQKLGISTIAELELACRQNRITGLSGFGSKSQEKILKGLEFYSGHLGQFLRNDALEEARSVVSFLRRQPGVQRVAIAGSLRRGNEVVRDIDLVCSSSDPEGVMDAFVKEFGTHEVIGRGTTRSSVRLARGLQADLRAVSDVEFPFALMYFTGSKEHNTAMRERARKMGLKLNEYGLFRGDDPILCADEASIFRALELSDIPPELREDLGEIEAADAGRLPTLVADAEIRGALHCHTTYSDGLGTLEEMVETARRLGFGYLGVSDHSQSAVYAGGLSVERLEDQWDEIDRLNSRLEGFRILKGIESEILEDGSLDYPDPVLARFDFVIGSVHSLFRLSKEQQTLRIVRAMENPHLNLIGHVTGRLLLERASYEVDVETVLSAAARNGVAIEFNAHPQRLDLDWRHIRRAVELGVMTSINPDAHTPSGLSDIYASLVVARKGWLPSHLVLNTRSTEDLLSFFGSRRVRS